MAAPTIHEVRLPEDISRGATGGPRFKNIVITSAGGGEQRIAQWEQARWYYDVTHALRNPTQAQALQSFFLARFGNLHGFRFKDWSDYTVTNEPLTYEGDTLQLQKTYTSGAVTYERTIYKPVSGTVTMRRNGASFTAFTVDTTTGLITLTPILSGAITGITKAANAEISSAGHGLSNGLFIYFSGVLGMTEINGLFGDVVLSSDPNLFRVNIDSSGFSTYTSGGTWKQLYNPADDFDWSGEFDVPVRLDVAEMEMEQQDVGIRNWSRIPLAELRG